MLLRAAKRNFHRHAGGRSVLLLMLWLVHPAFANDSSSLPEFGGQCVLGLAAGRRVDTDCGIHWLDDAGRRYCFEDEASRAAFLTDPERYLRQANEFLAASETEATASTMEHYTGEEVRAFVESSIRERAAQHGGTYRLHDTAANRSLDLVFEKIDFMRTLHGYGFFPEAIFHDSEDAEKKYLVDFWVKPAAEGLRILDVRIYKAPKREGDAWVLNPRMPRPWWWIPASEHPGEMEEKRGWEIMSAIEEHIVTRRAAGDGVYRLRDDITGEELALEFVGTHLPVRRLSKDGRYFACTDFRRPGRPDEVYDVDFWLDDRDGRISVGKVRVHKVPVNKDGAWSQEPRYDFDGVKFEIVP